MKQTELLERIAELEEKTERLKSGITEGFSEVKQSLNPKNIAKNTALNIASKVRNLFSRRKKKS